MKKIIHLFIIAIMMISLTSGCKITAEDYIQAEKTGVLDNILKYERCPREGNAPEPRYVTGEVLLFDWSKTPDLEEIRRLSGADDNEFGLCKYMICDLTRKSQAYMATYGQQPIMCSTFHVCNFPYDFNWKIPNTGLNISLEGDVFELGGFQSPRFDFVLTSLIIK